MKFWQSLAYSEPDQLIGIARICDELGFDGAFVSDHMFYPKDFEKKYPYSEDGDPGFTAETPWPDSWVSIASMAAVTTKLRFTTFIYLLGLRNPIEVAKSTSTLGLMTDNRFALGVGAGWMREEFEAMGVEFKTRGKRLDESIEVLHKLWSGELVEHHGDHFNFDPLLICPVPQKRVPVWVGESVVLPCAVPQALATAGSALGKPRTKRWRYSANFGRIAESTGAKTNPSKRSCRS